MKNILTGVAALALLASAPVRAEETTKTDHESVTGAAHESSRERAEDVSHGQQGARMKKLHAHTDADEGREAADADAARREAEKRAGRDSDAERDDAANRSAVGAAASAAKSANADSHAAAGQARATKARGGAAPGTGAPNRSRGR